MTRQPVSATVPANTVPFPLSVRDAQEGWKILFFRTGRFQSNPPKSDEWNRGAYLAEALRAIQNRAAELIEGRNGGSLLVDDSGVEAALASAKQKIERTYSTGTVMHFALEPVNALAFEKDGVFEIHTGNQWQTLIVPVPAKALGRSQDKIVLRSYLIGGGLGRRLDGDSSATSDR